MPQKNDHSGSSQRLGGGGTHQSTAQDHQIIIFSSHIPPSFEINLSLPASPRVVEGKTSFQTGIATPPRGNLSLPTSPITVDGQTFFPTGILTSKSMTVSPSLPNAPPPPGLLTPPMVGSAMFLPARLPPTPPEAKSVVPLAEERPKIRVCLSGHFRSQTSSPLSLTVATFQPGQRFHPTSHAQRKVPISVLCGFDADDMDCEFSGGLYANGDCLVHYFPRSAGHTCEHCKGTLFEADYQKSHAEEEKKMKDITEQEVRVIQLRAPAHGTPLRYVPLERWENIPPFWGSGSHVNSSRTRELLEGSASDVSIDFVIQPEIGTGRPTPSVIFGDTSMEVDMTEEK